MADLALESFSISTPLIEFHDATSQCLDGEVVEKHPYVVTRFNLSSLVGSISFVTYFTPGLNYAPSVKPDFSTPRRITRCATK